MNRRGALLVGGAALVGGRGQPRPLNAPGPPSTPPALVPGSRNVIRAREVIVSGGAGSVTGVFVYNGTPASGNPPQVAIVNGTTTTDPFGNPVTSSKILIQANVITETGGIFRTSAAAPLVQLDGPHDALLIYDAAGHLVDTITPVATNDGLGNTVYAGMVNYSTLVNAIVQLLNGFVQVGTPAQIAGTGGAAPGLLGLASAGNPGVVRVDSGLTAAADLDAFLDVRSKNAQASINAVAQRNIQLAGPLALSSESTPLQLATALLYGDGTDGHATVFDPDGGIYKVGHFTRFSTTDQTITSTTFATVASAATVGVGKYRVRAVLQCQQVTAAVADNFRLGFTGTISQVRMGAKFFNATAAALPTIVQTTSNNGVLGSPAYAVNTLYTVDFDGIITTTSTGILSIQAAESAAGDTFTVLALSFFHLEPIG